MAAIKDADKIEALKTIALVHRDEFDRRRKYEWKAFLTTLGVFTSSVIAKFSTSVSFPDSSAFNICIVIGFALLAFITGAYILSVQKLNEFNKVIAHKAENELMGIVQVKGLKIAKKNKTGDLQLVVDPTSTGMIDTTENPIILPKHAGFYWSFLWQVLVLFLFAAGCSYLITGFYFC